MRGQDEHVNVPWCEGDLMLHENPIYRLEKEIMQYTDYMEITNDDVIVRNRLIALISNKITRTSSKPIDSDFIEKFLTNLKGDIAFTNIEHITGARVPVIKGVHSVSGLHFDITVAASHNDSQITRNNILWIHTQIRKNKYILPLYRVVRGILRTRGFDVPYKGGASSFLTFLLIVSFFKFKEDYCIVSHTHKKEETKKVRELQSMNAIKASILSFESEGKSKEINDNQKVVIYRFDKKGVQSELEIKYNNPTQNDINLKNTQEESEIQETSDTATEKTPIKRSYSIINSNKEIPCKKMPRDNGSSSCQSAHNSIHIPENMGPMEHNNEENNSINEASNSNNISSDIINPDKSSSIGQSEINSQNRPLNVTISNNPSEISEIVDTSNDEGTRKNDDAHLKNLKNTNTQVSYNENDGNVGSVNTFVIKQFQHGNVEYRHLIDKVRNNYPNAMNVIEFLEFYGFIFDYNKYALKPDETGGFIQRILSNLSPDNNEGYLCVIDPISKRNIGEICFNYQYIQSAFKWCYFMLQKKDNELDNRFFKTTKIDGTEKTSILRRIISNEEIIQNIKNNYGRDFL